MSDQLPPHDMAAEAGVLGCVLTDPASISDLTSLPLEAFYDIRHRELFAIFRDLSSSGKPVTLYTVNQEADRREIRYGGLEYLTQLQDGVPSAANLPYYVGPVREHHLRRRILQACSDIAQRALKGAPVDDMLVAAQKLSNMESITAPPILQGREAALRFISDLERRHNLQGKLSGLDTGFYDLNKKTDGLQFGEQAVIGARPSMGKTAIGINIFDAVGIRNRVPSLFVSLEMSVEALQRRIFASRGGMTMNEIRRGSYSESDFKRFADFQLQLSKSPIHFMDAVGGVNINQLCVQIRQYCRKHSIKFVVVDYLQKIQPATRHEKRTYEVAAVSGALKSLAVDTGAAFLTLAQLNRESEKGKGEPPKLSDLADSGQIERDADLVALIHRLRSDPTGQTKLIIAKQRDGETGIVDLRFNGPYCRFENMTHQPEPQDVPTRYPND